MLANEVNFVKCCQNGQFGTARALTTLKRKGTQIDIHTQDDIAFKFACKFGDLFFINWFLQHSANDLRSSSANDLRSRSINKNTAQQAFYEAIQNNHFEVVKLLLKIEDETGIDQNLISLIPEIDIHAEDEKAFISIYDNEHFELAKWLYKVSSDTTLSASDITLSASDITLSASDERKNPINIHAQDEKAFRQVCYDGNLQLAKWLYEIGETTLSARSANDPLRGSSEAKDRRSSA